MRYWYPSSVNRGYFSYSQKVSQSQPQQSSIHPLSIEAISPTADEIDGYHAGTRYPSSVNRGYFSYTLRQVSDCLR